MEEKKKSGKKLTMTDMFNTYKQAQKNVEAVPYTPSNAVRVVGLGSAGSTFVHSVATRLAEAGNVTTDYITAITDAPDHLIGYRIQLGGLTKSCDDDSLKARDAAQASAEELTSVLKGAQLVVLAAGLGAGTGTGAAPVVADLCRRLDVLNFSVVTHPFEFEGEGYLRVAREGTNKLMKNTNAVVVVQNERRVLELYAEAETTMAAFYAEFVKLQAASATDPRYASFVKDFHETVHTRTVFHPSEYKVFEQAAPLLYDEKHEYLLGVLSMFDRLTVLGHELGLFREHPALADLFFAAKAGINRIPRDAHVKHLSNPIVTDKITFFANLLDDKNCRVPVSVAQLKAVFASRGFASIMTGASAAAVAGGTNPIQSAIGSIVASGNNQKFIDGCKGLLISVVGGSSTTAEDAHEAVVYARSILQSSKYPVASKLVIDANLKSDTVVVTLVAAGLDFF